MSENKLIYLAIPYSGIEAYSFEIANKVRGVDETRHSGILAYQSFAYYS